MNDFRGHVHEKDCREMVVLDRAESEEMWLMACMIDGEGPSPGYHDSRHSSHQHLADHYEEEPFDREEL